MQFKHALAGLIVILSAVAGTVVRAQNLELARNENAIAQTVAARLLTDIYKKAGLTATIQALPGARANKVTLAGEKDGEVARVPVYFVKNNTLVKVEPGFYYLTTAAFVKSGSGVSVKSKDDLKKYKVGIVRGIAHAEAATEGLADLQVTNNYKSLYQMLEVGRIEVAIDEGINGPVTLKELGIKDIEQSGEIARQDLHNVLTPKNKDLAPRISAAIKALKDSGELARLTRQYEAEALK